MSETQDASEVVGRYLAALGDQDWNRLEPTLAENVLRIGPYGDVVEGSTAYRNFLAEIVPQLKDYELRIERVAAVDAMVWVRLSETITDDSGRRLRTEEALLFDLDEQGKIARVEVYTQTSDYPFQDRALNEVEGRRDR